MKNVTVTLDEELASWVRVKAAKDGASVSRFLSQLLQDLRRQEEQYGAAQALFFSVEPRRLRNAGEVYPRREETHERGVR